MSRYSTGSRRVSICAEPFRLFFPAGILASVIGVSMWPLLYAGALEFYPGEAHARLMVECFVGAFAIGFISTAFPKMIGSPPLTWQELALVLIILLGCIAGHATNNLVAGDSCFLAMWILLIMCLATRFCFFRDSLPPPGFVLVAMGACAGITGVTFLLVGRIIQLTGFQQTLAKLLLYEGFLLGPILGVGGFLFARFFNDGRIESRSSGNRRAAICVGVALAVLATYIIEAAGISRWAPMLRAAIAGSFLFSQVRLFHRGAVTGSLSTLLRLAICCLLIGMVIYGWFPYARGVAVKHVLFIGGFGLLVLSVASRVVWGHSGNIELATGKRGSLRIILWVVVVTLATRVVAEFIPTIRVSHHIYAALLWVVAVAVWSWAVLRFVRQADPDDA